MAAHRLAVTITAHAWNADRSMLAICPNTPEVWIYTNCHNPDSSAWERTWVLKEHDLVVSGIDWCAATNRIVTCAHDRNAFVWNLNAKANVWEPQVVVLNINRAATDVKWSPDGSRFAVSSSAKTVLVCSYEAGNNWWISRAAKKHKSTVLTLAWHPSGQLLATASTDYRCRVISVPAEAGEGGASSSAAAALLAPFGGAAALPEFGEVLTEFEVTRSWVVDCAWSPSGRRLAFASHDSLLHVVSFAPEPTVAPVLQTLRTGGLPAVRLLWLSERAFVAAGHSMNPEVYAAADGAAAFAFVAAVDKKAEASKAATTASTGGGFGAARAMFASKVERGQSTGGAGGAADSGAAATKHQAAITYLQPTKTGKGAGTVSSFSSSGLDGRVVLWDLAAARAAEPALDPAALGVA